MKVTVADLGIGNLHSLAKALERQGATVDVTSRSAEWSAAKALVLPGVGSFGAGLRPLAAVRQDVRESLERGTPCLGVCLGMQLLYEESEEDPGQGVGFLRGRIRRFPAGEQKVPLMGWMPVTAVRPDPVLAGLPASAYYYFVHSYYAPVDAAHTVAKASHGVPFAAIVRRGNTVATQFHPEKSGPAGLALIRNWLEQAEAAA